MKYFNTCRNGVWAILIAIIMSSQANAEETDFYYDISAGLAYLNYQDHFDDRIENLDFETELAVTVSLDLNYKGFYIRSNKRNANFFVTGSEVGYQLISNPNWELDLIAKAYLPEIGQNETELTAGQTPFVPRESIEAAGFNYTRFFGDDLLQLTMTVTDFGGEGFGEENSSWISEVYYSHLRQYRNWDVYFNAGVTFYGKDLINYYYGIDSTESTSELPYYQTDKAGYRAFAEVYAVYPLAKDWTVNAGAKQVLYSSNITDSPIVKRSHETVLTMGLMYVF